MASFNPNNNKLFKNPSTVRSITKGLKKASLSILEEYNPTLVNTATNINKFAKDKKASSSFKVSNGEINENYIYKTGKQLIKNTLEDLKSGNFNNTERAEEAQKKMASSFFGGDFDMDELFEGWDDDNDSVSSSSSEKTRKTSTAEFHDKTENNVVISNTNRKGILKSFSSITNTYLTATNKTFSTVNVQLNNMIQFNNTKVDFYNEVSNQMNGINSELTGIVENMEQLSKIEIGGLKINTEFNQISSLLNSNELLSMNYYRDRLKGKENAKKVMNPIIQGMTVGIKALLPKAFKDALADTEDMMKALPLMINQKFKNMSEGMSVVGSMVGGLLYKDPSKVGSYNKGAVAWDGISRRSVVNVIPQLLSKMLNIVRRGRPGEELVYDYEAGGFRTSGSIKEAAHKQFASTSINSKEVSTFKNKVKQLLGDNSKKGNQDLDRAIYNMVKNKDIPSKNGSYTENTKIKTAMLEAWLNMPSSERAEFMMTVNLAKTPEEWLSSNESFHNVASVLSYGDLMDGSKKDPKFKEAMHGYLKSIGKDKLADKFFKEETRDGRSYKNMNKFNPFRYVVQGMYWFNDTVTKVLLDEDSIKGEQKDSLFKKVRTRVKDILKLPFKEQIAHAKSLFSREKTDSIKEEIVGSGIGQVASGFIGAVGSLGESKASGIKNMIRDKFIQPILNVFKNGIISPIKKAFTSLGYSIGSFFGVLTNKKFSKKSNPTPTNIVVGLESTSKVKEESLADMKANEEELNAEITAMNTNKDTKFNNIERIVITKNSEILSSLRTSFNNPVNKLVDSVKWLVESSKESTNKTTSFEMISKRFDNMAKNFRKLADINVDENPIVKGIKNITRLTGKTIRWTAKFAKNVTVGTAKVGFKAAKINVNITKKVTNKVIKVINSVIDKIKPARPSKKKKDKEISLSDKLDMLFGQVKDAGTSVAGVAIDAGKEVADSVANVFGNVINSAKTFIQESLPEIYKSTKTAVGVAYKKTIDEIKNLSSKTWKTVKEQSSKVWGAAKNILSDGFQRLTLFLNRFKGDKKVDIYIDGGYIDGIKNVVKIVDPKKSGYEMAQDKFAREDADDEQDLKDHLDKSGGAFGTIIGRIKDRAKRITENIFGTIKEVAKSGASAITTAVMSYGGQLVGKYGGKLLNKGFSAVGSLFKKSKKRMSKGKGNLGKILGGIGNIAGDSLSSMNAMKVYIVGGSLDGGGGGLLDTGSDILDTIGDLRGNKKSGGSSSKRKRRKNSSIDVGDARKLSRTLDVADDAADAVKATRKLGKIDTGLSAVDGTLGALGAIGDITSLVGRNSSGAERLESVVSLADTGKDIYSGVKTAKLAKTAVTGLKVAKTAKTAAAVGTAAAGATGAAATGAGILATGGALLIPLAGAWLTDRVFKGLAGWGKAGEIFQTEDPTLGMKVSSMAGSFLDAILPGDQSGWTKKIYSGANKLKDNVKNLFSKDGFKKASKFAFGLTPFGMMYNTTSKVLGIGADKLESETGKETLADKAKSIMGRVVEGKSSIITSMMAVTNPMGFLGYKAMKKYRDFKGKENNLENKFLNKLTPAEREEYLANKNAGLYGSMLRDNKGLSFLKKVLGTGLFGLFGGVGGAAIFGANEASEMLGTTMSSLVNEMKKNVPTGGTGDTGSSGGGVALADGDFVGKISMKYEVGESGNAGFISTGAGDAGGKSYGISQFTSAAGGASANQFVKWLQTYNSSLGNLFSGAGAAGSSSFDSAWKQAYQQDPNGFTQAQSAYTVKTYFDPFNNKSKNQLNLDWNRDRALQEAAYSTAVQFGAGGAMEVSSKAGLNGSMDTTTIINKLYDEKIRSIGTYKFKGCSGSVQNGVRNRFKNERNDVLALVGQPAGSTTSSTAGATNTNTQQTTDTGRSVTGKSTLPQNYTATNALNSARNSASINYSDINNIKSTIDNSPIDIDDPSVTLLSEMVNLLAGITDDTEEAVNNKVKTVDGKEGKKVLKGAMA